MRRDLLWSKKKWDRLSGKSRMRNGRQIAAYAYINRLTLFQSSGNGGIDQLMGIIQVINHGLKTSDGLKTAELLGEIGQADGVMQDPIGSVIVGVGAADDADDRQVLAVGPGDGVEHAEAAHGEGDGAGADTLCPGVAVGGVPGVELVAAADEVEAGLVDEVVEEGEVEVPWDGEDVRRAYLDQPPRQVSA